LASLLTFIYHFLFFFFFCHLQDAKEELASVLFDFVDLLLQKVPSVAASGSRHAQLKEAKHKLFEALTLTPPKFPIYVSRAGLYAEYSNSNEKTGFKGQKVPLVLVVLVQKLC